MQSEVRAPLVQAPIAWVARKLLASDGSVQAVMVLGSDGKVLAYERAIDDDQSDPIEWEDFPLLFYAPGPGILFYVRLAKRPMGDEIPNRISAILDSPSLTITR